MRWMSGGVLRIEGTDLRLRREYLWRPRSIAGDKRWLEWGELWERRRTERYWYAPIPGDGEYCVRDVWEPVCWNGPGCLNVT